MTDELEPILAQYITLFRGRGDAYGSWDGGCVREPLTDNTFRQHLFGSTFVGVYPCVYYKGETKCVWGCTDIDYDNPDEAWMLHDAFESVGVKSWVERTRRGYHIWVFATELVPASEMRRMFLAAHQVTGLNPKEVNPKQETLNIGQLGNYVRLPYPNGDTGERMMINRDLSTIPLQTFLDLAHKHLVLPETITRLAEYYKPPVITYTVSAPSHDMAESARRLTPLGRTIFRDGPIEGRDRSTTLTHLAHECRKANLNPEDALSILEDADLRWGKYMMRGEAGILELQKLLVRAYGHIQST